FKPDLNAQQIRAAYEKAGISAAQIAPASDSVAKTAVVPGAKTKAAPMSHANTGITDHTNTEIAQVLKGDLQAGDQLVIGSLTPSQKTSSSAPGMGGIPRGR